MGFGDLLRLRRQGRTLAKVSRSMEDAGHPTSASTLSAWERAEYLPKSAAQIAALETVLGCEGELTDALGWDQATPSRIGEVERRLEALERDLRELIAELRST